jgi:uncharacterized membrane protein (DUF441 family)
MTQAPRPQSPAAASAPRAGAGALVLALHESADGAALVVVRAPSAASGPTLVAANHLGPAEVATAVPAAIKRHRPAHIVRVAPSAWCVARAVSAPPGAGDRRELAQALALLAEAELPGTAPAHRRAAAAFDLADAAPSESVVLAAWVAGPTAHPAPVARTETWCPEPIALAALAALATRSASTLVARPDRASGVLTILGAGPRRPIARALRIDPGPDWDGAVLEAIAESAPALGIEPPASVKLAGAGLWLSSPIRPGAVTGADTADASWLARFGPALGAALVAASTDPAVRAGAQLLADSPELHTSHLHRAVAALASPSRVAAAVAIAAGLVLLAPVGTAAARYAVLSARAGGGGGTPPIAERLADAERRAAHAELLRARRWPMTKLWADVAGAAPVGVEIDALDLSPEDGLVIRGTAQSPDLAGTFRKRLSDTAVFRDIATPVLADEDGLTTFQLAAKVGAPLFRATPADDFAAKTLAQRLYGDNAAASSAASTTTTSGSSERDSGSRAGSRAERPRRDERASTERPAQPSGPTAGTPPPAELTDAAIAAMDRPTAMKEFAARRRAAATPGIDETTRQRLQSEATKLQQRMTQAASGGGTP